MCNVPFKPMGSLWRYSCSKVREAIELPFGAVGGVDPYIGVLDGGRRLARKRKGFGGVCSSKNPQWFEWCFSMQKCVGVGREKLTIFQFRTDRRGDRQRGRSNFGASTMTSSQITLGGLVSVLYSRPNNFLRIFSHLDRLSLPKPIDKSAYRKGSIQITLE